MRTRAVKDRAIGSRWRTFTVIPSPKGNGRQSICSGRVITIPEVDRAEWFGLAEARERILPAQADLLDRLAERV